MEAYSHIVLFIFILLLLVICILTIYIYRILKFKKLQKNYFEYLDSLFIMLAHDIKSPIIAMKEGIAIIKESLKNNDVINAINFIEKFDNTIHKLDHTTQSVLNFGKGYNFNEKPCDVKTVIENAIAYLLFAQQGAEKVNIEYVIENNFIIINHPNAIEIIIRNWIMNTIKHSNANLVHINISKKGKNAIFFIQDDGDIIENDVIKNIMGVISNVAQNEYTKQKKFGLFLIGTFLQFTKSTASLTIHNEKNTFIITTK